MGKTDPSIDHGVTDIEKKAEDIKSVVSPPVRAVQMGGTESDVNHDAAIDLEQRVDSSDAVVSPPVRAVKMGQAETTTEQAVDADDDFEQFAEVAVALDVGAPVRAIQLGREDVSEFANDIGDLNNSKGTKTESALVVEGAEIVAAIENEA